MSELYVDRHGYKINDPDAHGTGVEAPLDPAKLYLIDRYTDARLAEFKKNHPRIGKIKSASTAADRCRQTIDRWVRRLQVYHGLWDEVEDPQIDDLLGSCVRNPNGAVPINLSPVEMTKMFAYHKWHEPQGTYAENPSLIAWAKEGFINIQADDPKDPGIYIAEIAWRVGTSVYKHLDELKEDPNLLIVCSSHTGDIEPWLWNTLAIEDGVDIEKPDTTLRYFHSTGGALEPLTGVKLSYVNKELVLTHFTGEPYGPRDPINRVISENTLALQAKLLAECGRSEEVLSQKLRAA